MKNKHMLAARTSDGQPPTGDPPGNSLADLARVSHEIRTPLNVLLGLLDLATDTPLSKDQQEYFAMMQSAGKSLMTVVNDLLEFSRIQSAEIQLEHILFSVPTLIDETLAMLAFEASRKSLQLRTDLGAGLPDEVIGDPARLRQIIVNLVANAIRFSESGEIVVRAHRLANHAGKDEIALQFSVSDQGPGIAPALARRLFEPFRQAEAATWREHGGSGLGLNIVARLVALMHGQLWLDSQPDKGSTFHFIAKFGIAPSRSPEQRGHEGVAPPSADRPLDILMIEDNPMNRRLSEILLTQAGHRVTVLSDAADALPLLDRWEPDVILMDLNMPGMDGFTATAAIRAAERKQRHRPLPIIALTAHVDAETERRCRATGLDGCIAKPIDAAAMVAMLERFRQKMPRKILPATIDRRRLLQQVHGDPALLREIRDLFLRDSVPLLARLHDALAGGDAADFTQAAHTLHGMFHSLAAGIAQTLAGELEDLDLRTDGERANQLCERLDGEVRRLKSALSRLLCQKPGKLPLPSRPGRPHAHGWTTQANGRRREPTIFQSRRLSP